MISRTSERFRRALRDLPADVQQQARAAFRRFQQDPYHPSLYFKQVHSTRPIYSVRIGRSYRALGIRADDRIVWLWIGPHSEYDHVVARL